MENLVLPGNPPIEITLRQSTRARRMSLRVSQLDGRVTLTVPRGVRARTVEGFVGEKADWIRKHLANQSVPQDVGLGATVPIQGQDTAIRPGQGRAPKLLDGALWVPGGADRVGPRVAGYLKVRAREQLSAASDHYAARIGMKYGRISLRDTRSRWGSCSSDGNLMYSWRLIMAPHEVLDYVAAHEVAHLVEMNHGPRFWSLVYKICPHYERPRTWLRQNGSELHRYRF